MTRRLPLPFVAAVALLFCFACSRAPNDQPLASNEALTIEPKAGVGPVKAGMSVEQVVQVLGQPQRKTANALEYTSRGFAVIPGPDKVVRAIMCGDVTGLGGPLVKAFNGRTREGIGLGSTRDQVIKAYGEPSKDDKYRAGREAMRYDSLGITFNLENGKVHHLTVYLPPTEEKEQQRSIEVNMQ